MKLFYQLTYSWHNTNFLSNKSKYSTESPVATVLIYFLVTSFKCGSHVHDTGSFEKIVTFSFKIIIRLPAFLGITSAFCDEHFFRNRHSHLFGITGTFVKIATASSSTINSTKNKNTATQYRGFSKKPQGWGFIFASLKWTRAKIPFLDLGFHWLLVILASKIKI